MNLVAYFTSGGTPAEGLAPLPTISVWGLDGTPYIASSSMTEVAGGFYTFNFSGYDYTVDYVMRSYASQLDSSEQYVVASNEADSQNTQGVVKEILGLSQGNFIMSGQTYDENGRLLTSDMFTYDNSTDTDADTNRLHEYEIVADYDANGNLIKYKVTNK